MMPEFKVSVAMCTYNGASFVEEQLRSILSQSRPPDEVVICDDTSNDGTVEIIQKVIDDASIPMRLLVHDGTLGSNKNFEKCIQQCRGDIIFLSDQDDVWRPSKVERMVQEFAAKPDVGLVFSNAELVNERLESVGRWSLWRSVRFDRYQRRCIKHGNGLAALLKHNIVTGATMAFRAKYREVITPFPDCWVHDGWIALMISVFSGLSMIEVPLIQYRQHAQSQIGARTSSLGMVEKLSVHKRPKSETRAEKRLWQLSDEIGRYESAFHRVKEVCDFQDIFPDLAMFEAKLGHLNDRLALGSSRLNRLPIVLKELTNAHYHHYSNGWDGVIKDIIA